MKETNSCSQPQQFRIKGLVIVVVVGCFICEAILLLVMTRTSLRLLVYYYALVYFEFSYFLLFENLVSHQLCSENWTFVPQNFSYWYYWMNEWKLAWSGVRRVKPNRMQVMWIYLVFSFPPWKSKFFFLLNWRRM